METNSRDRKWFTCRMHRLDSGTRALARVAQSSPIYLRRWTALGRPQRTSYRRRTLLASQWHLMVFITLLLLDLSANTICFTGTAIYVFFILANNPGPQHPFTITETAANFTLDNEPPVLFQHVPNNLTEEMLYNQLVFQQTNLESTQHLLIISVSGIQRPVWVNFDYAIYTQVLSFSPYHHRPDLLFTSHEDLDAISNGQPSKSSEMLPTTSGSSLTVPEDHGAAKSMRVVAIVGGTVGGIVVMVLLILVILVFQRRRRRMAALRYEQLAEVEQRFQEVQRQMKEMQIEINNHDAGQSQLTRDDLQEAMRELNAQVRGLNQYRQSSQALSEEAPPGYRSTTIGVNIFGDME